MPRVGVMLESIGLRCGRGQQVQLAVVQLRPAQFATHMVFGIDSQPAGETVDAEIAGNAGVAQRHGEAVSIEAEGEQAAAMRTTRGPGVMRGAAHGVREIPAQHPRHIGKHQALEILVGARVGLERIGDGIGRDIAGVVKA